MPSNYQTPDNPPLDETRCSAASLMDRIPKLLQQEQMWCVLARERRIVGGVEAPFTRYSPVTLDRLCPDKWNDYGTLATALKAVTDSPDRFYGVSIRVSPPWLGVILPFCLDASGSLKRSAEELLTSLGGYWESVPRLGVAVGILSEPPTPKVAIAKFEGGEMYVSTDGFLNLSGNIIPGHAGDPLNVNRTFMESFFSSAAPGSGTASLETPERRAQFDSFFLTPVQKERLELEWEHLAAMAWRGFKRLGRGAVTILDPGDYAVFTPAAGLRQIFTCPKYDEWVHKYDPRSEVVIIFVTFPDTTNGFKGTLPGRAQPPKARSSRPPEKENKTIFDVLFKIPPGLRR